MGFRSLFNRKKKLLKKSTSSSPTTVTENATFISRTPSLSFQSRVHFAEDLEHVFRKFDVNGDGKISSSELGSIMRSLGQAATEEELNQMIREVDADGDGHINLEEFIELNTKDIDPNEVLENLKDAFSVFDLDKNGSISAEELHNVMVSLGDQCSLAECQKMIGGVDSDGDGMIDFEEFKMMMLGSTFGSMERTNNAEIET
ncbi:putative calcium-binding protein CML25 [Trifolium repens]|nr:putative calcium-binding protein CML25 [Trifolium repens]